MNTDNPLRLSDAALCLLTAGLAMVGVTNLLGVSLPTLVAAQLIGIAGSVLILCVVRRPTAWPTLIGQKPALRDLVGAVAIGSTFWLVLAIALLPLLEGMVDPKDLEHIEKLIVGDTPLWFRLVGVALVPAICEELLFRGVVHQALRRRFPAIVAIVVGALLFAAFHMDARIIPTAVIGALLGWVRESSRSIIPGMVLHGSNNGAAVLLTTTATDTIPTWWVVLGLAISAVGFVLIGRRPNVGR
jgi:sodium transport system permease protein